ncbi:heavy-metal-associated domain-containing protein [Aquimarina sp. AD10]|uniref:Heavy metal transporter n=1 Tax=Aquimarina aggregata TaxID=1642818 RepID=A0A162ZQM9_9FLAO|nr:MULTISPECIES: heavy metal-associated domain-containing protein [Aquimarina]AXT62284.1 heavy-metal-associated domain-containing protein [Aquimarina sp. AD10]KZS39962.1 heavy metal transporter [Aquimarina aggregata]RKM90521.1 heavy-metal-associated domain-containing protein [Aquimarina sp. AD10]
MKTTVAIQNLKCAGCESTIAKKLHMVQGIYNISVNTENCTVSFNYKTEDGLNTVQNELSKLGYPSVGDKNNLSTKAKSYVSCAIGRLTK